MRNGRSEVCGEKISLFLQTVVDTKMGRPYNPPIADDRGAAGGHELKQTTENVERLAVSVFEFRRLPGFEKRVLTD
jgi:hypothetical protein